MVAPRRERFTQEVPIARQRLAGASILAILAALTLTVSPVAGFHWTPKTILAGPDDSVDGSRSAIAADGSRLYVTYVEGGAAWLRSSTDGGASFGAPIQVSDPAATDVGSTSVAAANGIGYVTWIETAAGTGPRAWLRRTEDHGDAGRPRLR